MKKTRGAEANGSKHPNFATSRHLLKSKIEMAKGRPGRKGPVKPEAVEAPPAEPISREYSEKSAFEHYLREVSAVKLLSRKEEKELFRRYKNGDESAREHLIKANLRFVIKLARDYENVGLPLLDLISEGNIGLMISVERFDLRKGAKLSTYASWWIKQAMKRALANQLKTIRLPVHVVDKIFKIRRASNKIWDILGREPTHAEIAAEVGIRTEAVARLQQTSLHTVSLDAHISGNEDSSVVADFIEDRHTRSADDICQRVDSRVNLDKLIKDLPAREQMVIRRRFGFIDGETETLDEISHTFGVTRERIRQIEVIAIRKLRRMFRRAEGIKAEDWEASLNRKSRRSYSKYARWRRAKERKPLP